jgi:hypothetical protein
MAETIRRRRLRAARRSRTRVPILRSCHDVLPGKLGVASNGEDEHLYPGNEIDDPESVCQESSIAEDPIDSCYESNFDPAYGGDGTLPFFPLPFVTPRPTVPFPLPSPMPIF